MKAMFFIGGFAVAEYMMMQFGVVSPKTAIRDVVVCSCVYVALEFIGN